MGFNKRKIENHRRRATEKQILEDAEHLIMVWNERQAKRMPMLFSPTVCAAITAGCWFLRGRCPACHHRRRRPAGAPLAPRRGRDGANPSLSCRACRPNAPFAELVCLSKSSVAEDFAWERSGNKWVNE
jgi:hypothetical protein